jgi:hypothetical protein
MQSPATPGTKSCNAWNNGEKDDFGLQGLRKRDGSHLGAQRGDKFGERLGPAGISDHHLNAMMA